MSRRQTKPMPSTATQLQHGVYSLKVCNLLISLLLSGSSSHSLYTEGQRFAYSDWLLVVDIHIHPPGFNKLKSTDISSHCGYEIFVSLQHMNDPYKRITLLYSISYELWIRFQVIFVSFVNGIVINWHFRMYIKYYPFIWYILCIVNKIRYDFCFVCQGYCN